MTKPRSIGQLDRETVLACECSPKTRGAIKFRVRKPYASAASDIWVDPKLLPNYATLGPGVVKL